MWRSQWGRSSLDFILFNFCNLVFVVCYAIKQIGQVLSDIGGTLGLWLGLGVLQLFQSVAAAKYNVAAKTSLMIHDYFQMS